MNKLTYDPDSMFVKLFNVRHDRGIKEFKKRIEKGEPLAVIARDYNFSRAYASLVFKKIFNMNYTEYKKQSKT